MVSSQHRGLIEAVEAIKGDNIVNGILDVAKHWVGLTVAKGLLSFALCPKRYFLAQY